jgi:hypothetical protein
LTKALGPEHWRTASAEAAEGAALAGLGQPEKAEQLLLESYKTLHGDKGAVHIYVANSERWLAKLYRSTNRPAEAAKYVVSKHG